MCLGKNWTPPALKYSGAPSGDLAPFVRRFYVYDDAAARPMRIPASCRSFVLVHFGEQVRAEIGDERMLPGPTFVAGPPTQPFTIHPMGNAYRFIAVELTDIGLFSFFGDVAGKLTNSLRPMSDFVAPEKTDALAERVTRARTTTERVEEVAHFLRRLAPSRLSAATRYTARFSAAAKRSPELRVAEVSRQLGLSTALLRKHVKRVSGLSPKVLLDANRLGTAFTTAYDDPHLSLTELAHRLDYFDLAHFSRAFKRYSGHAPSAVPRDAFSLARCLM